MYRVRESNEQAVHSHPAEWDAENLKATNAPEVMHVVKKEYRLNYGTYLDA